jgi:hypothetical protein
MVSLLVEASTGVVVGFGEGSEFVESPGTG